MWIIFSEDRQHFLLHYDLTRAVITIKFSINSIHLYLLWNSHVLKSVGLEIIGTCQPRENTNFVSGNTKLTGTCQWHYILNCSFPSKTQVEYSGELNFGLVWYSTTLGWHGRMLKAPPLISLALHLSVIIVGPMMSLFFECNLTTN